ncbi:SixA phosphatase family protein [Allorhodopirellula solitaria]|uniref:Phosphohistidine phosphatase n=1 Tax=Allorhodopirellula solitaria TaxID=2527987 RepID=A0A5C5XRJ4_9BACT|nr:histidine phosphatase family protein [Allorhodopirellula solitaria]TWT64685.1 phosphohistidine phosphatase [Allorhodopirellula solitaria]
MTNSTSTSPLSAESTADQGYRLLLMRHAKSDWSDGDLTDHNRPLNDRGLRDAPTMARWLAESGVLPDQILCSSAARTQQTAALMQSYWENTKQETAKLQVLPQLYLSPAETILETVQELGAGFGDADAQKPRTILVLAHNPGISHAASSLLGHPTGLPTAALVVLQCLVSGWAEPLTSENTQLIVEMTPKSIQRDGWRPA